MRYLTIVKKYICAGARRLVLSLRRLVDRCCAERPQITHSSKINFHALQVLLTAYRARNRAVQEETAKRAAGETLVMVSDAMVAVVLAAAATEAFINEFAENISIYRQNAANWNPNPITPQMAAAASAILDLEFFRRSVLDKYAAAAKVLGKPLDKGSPVFQDFDRLSGLRDALMHIHPVRPSELHRGEKIADELAARGIAMERGPGEFAWYDRVQTADVARWACNSARAISLAILDRVPPTPGEPFKFVQERYRNYPGLDSEDWV
jgi:hypothetical protein